jgi:hypothetical protein
MALVWAQSTNQATFYFIKKKKNEYTSLRSFPACIIIVVYPTFGLFGHSLPRSTVLKQQVCADKRIFCWHKSHDCYNGANTGQ